MKSTILLMAAIILISAYQTKSSENQINNQNKVKMETNEKQEIKNLLFSYRDALSWGDVHKKVNKLAVITGDAIYKVCRGYLD